MCPSSEVTPRSKPTVAKAETHVKSISKNEKFSPLLKPLLKLNNRAIINTNKNEPTVIPTAFRTTLSDIWRLRIIISFWPRKVALVAAINAAIVVVLIPPPVPPGLAPINIRKRCYKEKIKQISEYSIRKEEIKIDLNEQKIIFGNNEIKFDLDQFKKKCLIEGLDDIALSLEKSEKIVSFEKKLIKSKPWIFND